MAGKQAPLIIRQEEGVDYTPGELVDARVETPDVANAAWDLARVDTPGGALWDAVKAAALDVKGKELSPQELNDRYDLEDTFKVPMTESAAAVIAERAQRRKKAEEVMSRAESGMLNTAVSFGTSVVANMIDPLNLAADIAVGKGLGILARSGKIAMMTSWGARGASAGRRFGEAAVEGALGNLAVEPLVFGARSLENRERGFDEVAIETVAGALAFPAVKFAGGELLGRGLQFVNGLDARSANNFYRSLKAQVIGGKKLNVEPLTREQVKMTSEHVVPEGKALFGSKTDYNYVPKETVQPNDSFYVSVLNSPDDIADAKFGTFADDYGGTVNLTDNAFAANGASARITGDSIGNVFEVRVDPEAKIINLERTLGEADPQVREAVKAAYEKATGLEFKFDDDVSLKDVYEDLYGGSISEKYRAEVTSEFNQSIKEAGFDGYRHDGTRLAEMEHSPHNVLALFDPEKAKVVGQNKADPAFVGRISLEERMDLLKKSVGDEAVHFWEDSKTAKQMEQELEEVGISLDRPNIEEFRSMDTAKVDEEVEMAFRDERITEAEYKAFKEYTKTANKLMEADKQLQECLTGVRVGE